MGWKERSGYIRKVAAAIERRRFELSALLSMEVGKNRMEAMGDVQETADLMVYYCDQLEAHKGYEEPMQTLSPKEDNRDVLRPYGVWVIIAPFNFPMALAGGPSSGALLGGNTVVFKPASDTPLAGWKLTECFREAGLPEGVFNFVTGPGSSVGEELVTNPGAEWTGSCSPDRKRSGSESTVSSPASIPSRASPRWEGRTPRSSPPRPTSTPPPRVS
jgi:1-pyrroline-5-carboxylate dehydrogenase